MWVPSIIIIINRSLTVRQFTYVKIRFTHTFVFHLIHIKQRLVYLIPTGADLLKIK